MQALHEMLAVTFSSDLFQRLCAVIGGNDGNANGNNDANGSGNTVQRRQTDPRRTEGRCAGGGNPVPPLPAATLSDRVARARQPGRRGRRLAGWIAFRLPQYEAV